MYIRIIDGNILTGRLYKGNWWFEYKYNQFYLSDDKLNTSKKFGVIPKIKSQGINLIDVLEVRDMINNEYTDFPLMIIDIGRKHIATINQSRWKIDDFPPIKNIITHEQWEKLAQEVN